MKRLLTALALLMGFSLLSASTIGVATGSCTVDGRPLLFKNRDRTDAWPPDVIFYLGLAGEYSFVYHNTYSHGHTQARMGINTAGFGIGNTDSENLQGAGVGMNNGELIMHALKYCATIQDFRNMLDSTNGARRVHAHIGVIDSTGAGSLFEVDGFTYVELMVVDSAATMANTAKFHPNAGPPASGSTSPQREGRVAELFSLAPNGVMDYRYFVEEIMQDFSETQAIENMMPVGQYLTNPVISRYKTVAGAVIRGCKPGDNPLIESTMWLAMGEPSLSIVLPFFPNVPVTFAFVRPTAGDGGMAGSTDRMRQLVYSYANGRYGDHWADTYRLVDIRSYTFPLEDSLFHNYEQQLPVWRSLPAQQAADSMLFWSYRIQMFAKQEYDHIYQLLGVQKPRTEISQSTVLLHLYPNPFNGSLRLRYRITRGDSPQFRIYDVSGRLRWEKQLAPQSPGWHELELPFSAILPRAGAGIYFVEYRCSGAMRVKKVVYVP